MYRFVIDNDWPSDDDDQPLIIPGRIEKEKTRRTELMEGTSSMYAGESSNKEPDGQVLISGLTSDPNPQSLESELASARARIQAHSALYDDLGLVIAVFVVCVLIVMIAFNIAFAYLLD